MIFIKNAWYVAAESHELTGSLLGRTICGDPIVLFRDSNGAPAALEDRCCHRHLPLSLGKRTGDKIQCDSHIVSCRRSAYLVIGEDADGSTDLLKRRAHHCYL